MPNRNELYRAIPIFSSGLLDNEIKDFSVKYKQAEGLAVYLKGFAEADEKNGFMRTYIVRDNMTNEFVGYFSLKAGLISINEQKIGNKEYFDTIPGIELANFAINNTYLKNHPGSRGCGYVVYQRLIKPILYEVSERIGVYLFYIFSLPIDSLIKRYGEYGFKRLSMKYEEALHARLKPNYDAGCIFMFQEL